MREIEYRSNGSIVMITIEGLVEPEMLGGIVADLIGNMSRDVPPEAICTAIDTAMDKWQLD